MPKECSVDDVNFPHGAVVCIAGTNHKCNDGEWEDLGTPCEEEGDEEEPSA
jgi:hypothetical protein